MRSPEKAHGIGVHVVYLDLDKPETIAPALEGVDRAFMVTGYTVDMMRQSKDFLNIAKKAGVKYIVHLGAPYQKRNFKAAWAIRGSRAEVTIPKLPLLMFPLGLLNCAWLNVLNSSKRNWE